MLILTEDRGWQMFKVTNTPPHAKPHYDPKTGKNHVPDPVYEMELDYVKQRNASILIFNQTVTYAHAQGRMLEYSTRELLPMPVKRLTL